MPFYVLELISIYVNLCNLQNNFKLREYIFYCKHHTSPIFIKYIFNRSVNPFYAHVHVILFQGNSCVFCKIMGLKHIIRLFFINLH